MDRTQDRRLVAGLQAGNQAAVQELAVRYGPRIQQLAMRHMKNREDAEEVTQDVLMKVHKKIHAFRGDAALSSWIYRITFNTAMSRLRQNRAARAAAQERDRVEALLESNSEQVRAPKEPADWTAMPDEQVMRAQLRDALAAAVRELPEIYRAPVVLRDIEGLTTEEASSRLKVKDQTLKSRLHRGRLMLRNKLDVFRSGLSLHRPAPMYS
jgi:RNA polymerase sigma-70 factor (ECF subfamily)